MSSLGHLGQILRTRLSGCKRRVTHDFFRLIYPATTLTDAAILAFQGLINGETTPATATKRMDALTFGEHDSLRQILDHTEGNQDTGLLQRQYFVLDLLPELAVQVPAAHLDQARFMEVLKNIPRLSCREVTKNSGEKRLRKKGKRVATMPNTLPPFLFRAASSSGSRGINTATLIDPLAGTGCDYSSSISAVPTLHMHLYDHVSYIYKNPSEFSSWSASLLYVLVHANRKAHYHREPSVLIYVMDTRHLDPERVGGAVEMLRENHVASKNGILEQYAEGEFLVHGKLKNDDGNLWKAVDINVLDAAGLRNCFYHLRPEVGNDQKLKPLFPLVLRLRVGWFKEVAELPQSVVLGLRRLARCFGRKCEGIVMIALICLRKRTLDGGGMEIIREALGGMGLPNLDWQGDDKLKRLHKSVAFEKCPESVLMLRVLSLL